MNTWEQSSFSAIEIHNSITNGILLFPHISAVSSGAKIKKINLLTH